MSDRHMTGTSKSKLIGKYLDRQMSVSYDRQMSDGEKSCPDRGMSDRQKSLGKCAMPKQLVMTPMR